MHSHPPTPRFRRAGFSLVEMLIVIVIIVVLAVLSLSVANRMRVTAAKTNSVAQLRNMGVAILSWTTDRAAPEPFYRGDGTGDYPHEGNSYGEFRPGNPARALYKVDDPSAGYLQDFNVFFSPLSKLMKPAPTIATYDPWKVSESRLWGTYTYHFPHVTAARMNARHRNMGVETVGASNPTIDGRLMLSEFYRDDWCAPKFRNRIYHALLSDGSVQYVADNDAAWNRWKNGK